MLAKIVAVGAGAKIKWKNPVGLGRFVRYTLYKELSMLEQPRDTKQIPNRSAATANAGTSSREPLTPVEAQFVRELFEQHQFHLYRYLKGLLHSQDEAKEILQETYLRLLRQPSFEQIRENARAYLYKTATNLARDVFRLRAARGMDAARNAFSASGLDSPHWETWPEFALEGEQIGLLIVKALESVEMPVRTALLLHRFRDFTHQQIAVWLGVSERTVERYIKEGLSRIADQLEVGP
jgi:RNA polymerase sigma-70 factor (ECF subfamily)